MTTEHHHDISPTEHKPVTDQRQNLSDWTVLWGGGIAIAIALGITMLWTQTNPLVGILALPVMMFIIMMIMRIMRNQRMKNEDDKEALRSLRVGSTGLLRQGLLVLISGIVFTFIGWMTTGFGAAGWLSFAWLAGAPMLVRLSIVFAVSAALCIVLLRSSKHVDKRGNKVLRTTAAIIMAPTVLIMLLSLVSLLAGWELFTNFLVNLTRTAPMLIVFIIAAVGIFGTLLVAGHYTNQHRKYFLICLAAYLLLCLFIPHQGTEMGADHSVSPHGPSEQIQQDEERTNEVCEDPAMAENFAECDNP